MEVDLRLTGKEISNAHVARPVRNYLGDEVSPEDLDSIKKTGSVWWGGALALSHEFEGGRVHDGDRKGFAGSVVGRAVA